MASARQNVKCSCLAIVAAAWALLLTTPGSAQSLYVAPPLPLVPLEAAAPSRQAAAVASGLAKPDQYQVAIDRRIAALRLQLGITGAQLPLWSTFAHAIRQTALDSEALSAQRDGAIGTMSAPDNMRDYARITRAYADATERLAAAFDRLYLLLSPSQQHTADALFRELPLAARHPER